MYCSSRAYRGQGLLSSINCACVESLQLSMADSGDRLPESVTQNLFVKSTPHPEEFTTKVEGYQFCKPGAGDVDYHALLRSYRTSGFQATNFGLAVEEINRMVWYAFN